MKQFIQLIIFSFLVSSGLIAQNNTSNWTLVNDKDDFSKSTRLERPEAYSLFQLKDYQQLFDHVLRSPSRFETEQGPDIFIKLPMPDGAFATYRVLSSPVFEEGLSKKYPAIKSYTAIGIGKTKSVAKIDFSPRGFHAMIRTTGQSPVFIDPFRLEDQLYMCYYKSDYPMEDEPFSCETIADEIIDPSLDADRLRITGDCQLRQYRLALACTGEYAQYHGGTKPLVLAAMNTTMNRVNGIFEEEASLTMLIIANNDEIIFLNASTDPYTNGDGGAMLGENQTTCDNLIGTANYDIGHVFSTGGGGVATLRSPCNDNIKARGVTGRSIPVGDPFDVDYVAHEMGHQYGGNHTQNNSCQRSSKSYEPGSASTIMGYAGICPPNIQSNSDPYYHGANLSEFGAFVTNSGTGGSCPLILSSANDAPSANAGLDLTVPISTAFTLTGIGTDINGDMLSYCWEQYNNAISTQPPLPSNTDGPNFRSVLPKDQTSREFPKNGQDNQWEVLPDNARTMDFRLTVRDYNTTYAYGCTDEDYMELAFDDNFGPFKITAANGGENWVANGLETVTWNVANTDQVPISCNFVDILLSLDGGLNYDSILVLNTPNDGSEPVLVPDIINSTARIKIRAVGSVFFDVSDNDFTIGPDINCMLYPSTDIPVLLPNNTTGSYFSALNIPDSGIIFSIEAVNLTGTHSWVGDLEFKLINPAGNSIDLLTKRCGNLTDFDMNFMDGAPDITCPLDAGNTYDPVDSLSTFVDTEMAGTWQLQIDDTYPTDGGQLNSWGLNICYYNTVANCMDNLSFISDPIPSGQYYAYQNIIATQSLMNAANVLMQAGIGLEFGPGFTVPQGAVFEAKIGACP
jgi:subtilisin-like proprotein convertase family protein